VTAQGDWAYRFVVRDGDDSWGERCELAQGNPTRTGRRLFERGADRWIAFQVFFPASYPLGQPRWSSFFQVKQLGALGAPVLALQAQNNEFVLQASRFPRDDPRAVRLWSGPARQGGWCRFLVHIRFSPSKGAGRVALYGDSGTRDLKPLVRERSWATMKLDRKGQLVPSHARIGLYRDARIVGTAAVLIDGFTVSEQRDVAVRNAFGGSPVR
jgi:hypothetical protein